MVKKPDLIKRKTNLLVGGGKLHPGWIDCGAVRVDQLPDRNELISGLLCRLEDQGQRLSGVRSAGVQQDDAAGRELFFHTGSDILCTEALPIQSVQAPLDGNTAGAMDAVDDEVVVGAGGGTEQDRFHLTGGLDALPGKGDLL